MGCIKSYFAAGLLLPQHYALHGSSFAACWIAVDNDGAQSGVALRRLKFSREAREKTLQHKFFLNADHAIVGACHTHVSLVGSAHGQNASVGCRNMSMGSQDGGNPAIEIPSKRHLL